MAISVKWLFRSCSSPSAAQAPIGPVPPYGDYRLFSGGAGTYWAVYRQFTDALRMCPVLYTKAGGIEVRSLLERPKTLLLAQYVTTRILVFD